ncbi:MAG: hypothetical protein JWM74_3909 [Myxococcaceae bacterium]|nr:hypothetical protein [Myxococcaceae bacterium]
MNRFVLALFVGLAGCNMGPSAEPSSSTNTSSATTPVSTAAAVTAVATEQVERAPAPAPAGTLVKLGQPVTIDAVSLSDIAKNPKAYKGKSIATTGTVKAVCQEQGCWMEIVDAKADANVRMHGHSFFVPKTAHGKQAKVQGTVMLMKDGMECDEMAATGAQLQLDATGVELM